MKVRRRRGDAPALSWISFFWCTLFLVLSSAIFTTLATLRHFYSSEPLHFTAIFSRQPARVMQAKSSRSSQTPEISVRETVVLPNQALVFLDYPPSFRLPAEDDIKCAYSWPNSSLTYQPPLLIEYPQVRQQMVRCPLHLLRLNVSVTIQSKPYFRPNYKWHPLVYEALFDRDNSTIVFVKGFNLRPAREADASRFECLFGWDFTSLNYLLTSDVISIAQEIVRCRTPSSILTSHPRVRSSVKVSVKAVGRKLLPTIAMPGVRLQLDPPSRKHHVICMCTMLRNQARFIKEWIMYHTRIGVQRWFIYDNNSDDDITDVIGLLLQAGYNITRHVWPWVKTQEAGFADCALRARDVCEWVGFIDVDEFFNLKTEENLEEAIVQETRGIKNVGEIRTGCYSFGPSGLNKIPREGVMVGYTCRKADRERHKSIVRPEALNQNLINVVHHFQLKDGYVAVDANRTRMVINHYKYQVWKVFKGKFERRVSAYVVDWKTKENEGSKDRVPGLGSSAVEPPDWSNRFCEVWDRSLRRRVERMFMDPTTGLLPWQPKEDLRLRKPRRRKRRQREVSSRHNEEDTQQVAL
ncbi:hypothetical protein QN277_013685 [Acacia crassicarpa]|uniref:Glycosyltransferase family 92 protein n=1 Tax=Acacia crassicarpa TaxID=499986 RepID=A0AAE1TG14_9FABA|nr:hypothetical protein QN277_013685 [Acacia crassicarpa]